MPEDFLLKLSRLGDQTDTIIPKVLEAGGKVVLEKMKSNLRSAIGRGTKYKSRSTGKLAAALDLDMIGGPDGPILRAKNEKDKKPGE